MVVVAVFVCVGRSWHMSIRMERSERPRRGDVAVLWKQEERRRTCIVELRCLGAAPVVH